MSDDRILLAHGSGGVQMHALIRDLFVAAFDNEALRAGGDSALLEPAQALPGDRLAFTSDGYVVQPLVFAGGTIGSLAVHGTINDLAVAGAEPLALSAAFIIEEGLPLATLRTIVHDMAAAARAAGVPVVTGDTKVVARGQCDALFITTAGVGRVRTAHPLVPASMRSRDVVVLSAPVGAHGIAVMSARAGMEFETPVASDTRPLHTLTRAMCAAVPAGALRVMRDVTRGGLATTLNELAAASACAIEIDEDAVMVEDAVAAACALLGFDVLHLANEGVLVAVVAAEAADALVAAMRADPAGAHARVIGRVDDRLPGTVRMRTPIGGTRMITMLSGDLLPRIC
jgi:hydrogenase expression/formation protein HypE